MDLELMLIQCFAILAIVFVVSVTFVMWIDNDIRTNFCKSEGFDGEIMGFNLNEGYCYKTNNEITSKKEFLCEPNEHVFETIGKCGFIGID